ncbi:hypothetical protein LZ31DRAFT_176503 [Colletotrichum somersetense]|nr:hypothetical protein LZ31DRAFT_176503 [Colletotrichum somersetense]
MRRRGATHRPGKPRTSLTRLAGVCYDGIMFLLLLPAFYLGWALSLKSSDKVCVDTAWSELRNHIRRVPYTFDPHFVTPPSGYMGQPNPELDKKWYHLAELRNFVVDRETLARANKSRADVQWPGTQKYQAGLEAFYQLHCLHVHRITVCGYDRFQKKKQHSIQTVVR